MGSTRPMHTPNCGEKKLFFNFYFFKKEEIVLALDN